MTCALCPEHYECPIRGTQQEGSCQFYNHLRGERENGQQSKSIKQWTTAKTTRAESHRYTAYIGEFKHHKKSAG